LSTKHHQREDTHPSKQATTWPLLALLLASRVEGPATYSSYNTKKRQLFTPRRTFIHPSTHRTIKRFESVLHPPLSLYISSLYRRERERCHCHSSDYTNIIAMNNHNNHRNHHPFGHQEREEEEQQESSHLYHNMVILCLAWVGLLVQCCTQGAANALGLALWGNPDSNNNGSHFISAGYDLEVLGILTSTLRSLVAMMVLIVLRKAFVANVPSFFVGSTTSRSSHHYYYNNSDSIVIGDLIFHLQCRFWVSVLLCLTPPSSSGSVTMAVECLVLVVSTLKQPVVCQALSALTSQHSEQQQQQQPIAADNADESAGVTAGNRTQPLDAQQLTHFERSLLQGMQG